MKAKIPKWKLNLDQSMKYHGPDAARTGEPEPGSVCTRFPSGLRVAPYHYEGLGNYCLCNPSTGEVFKCPYNTMGEALARLAFYTKE